MRGGAVFLAFFVLFTFASLAVPVPLFPGNMIPVWFNLSSTDYAPLIRAVVNGVAYGLVVWLVFVLATRKLDESGVSDYKAKKTARCQRNKRSTVKQ